MEGFRLALEGVPDALAQRYPEAVVEADLYCDEPGDLRGCWPELAHWGAEERQLDGRWRALSLPPMPAQSFVAALRDWRPPNEAVLRSALGVTVAAPLDGARPALVSFVRADCASSPLPPPYLLLALARLTFASVGFVLLVGALAVYLLAGHTLFVLSFEQPSALGGLLHLQRLRLTLHLFYLWPRGTAD